MKLKYIYYSNNDSVICISVSLLFAYYHPVCIACNENEEYYFLTNCVYLKNINFYQSLSQFNMYNIQTDFTFHYLPQVFKWVNPRLVVSGHTHHGCHRIHDNGVPEWTVASFSWRNKKGPSFLLVCLFISWVSTLSVHSSTAKMRQIGILLTFGFV